VIGLPGGPWHVESARIFYVDRNLQCFPAFSQLEALDYMKLGRVRRAIIIDVGVLRAGYIKDRLEAGAGELRGRLISTGRGSRELIVGTGRDDTSDAVDRRVEFKVIRC
jgi:hypothetical protein